MATTRVATTIRWCDRCTARTYHSSGDPCGRHLPCHTLVFSICGRHLPCHTLVFSICGRHLPCHTLVFPLTTTQNIHTINRYHGKQTLAIQCNRTTKEEHP